MYDDINHFFPWVKYKNKTLVTSWVAVEDEDLSQIMSVYFDVVYSADVETIPNGFIFSGVAKDLNRVREMYAGNTQRPPAKLTKEEMENTSYLAVHTNFTQNYEDQILTMDIKSVSMLQEIDSEGEKGLVTVWIPFSVSEIDVMKKLGITKYEKKGVCYAQRD